MDVLIFVLIVLIIIYFSNVISCAILCEQFENLSLIKRCVFIIPILNLSFLLYLLFSKDSKHSGIQGALSYIKTPAKNLLSLKVLADVLSEAHQGTHEHVVKSQKVPHKENGEMRNFVFNVGTRLVAATVSYVQ